MDKTELLLNYAANLSGSRTKNHYLKYAKGFLDQADSLDKEAVGQYIARLKRKNYRPGTLNFVFRVIKRLFTVNGLEWPYSRGQAPQVSEQDESRPALLPELIQIMIEAAKAGKLAPDESCFLALSTIYGVRRQEMMDMQAKDVDLKAGTIFIRTVKHGRQRYHLIPAEIADVIGGYDFTTQYSASTVSQIFWAVVNKSNLEPLQSERLGWHSIRRAVLSGLIDNGLNPFAARSFLRWKSTMGELAMPARYYSNVTIGLKGKKVVSEEAKGDKEIFEKYHPFLSFWRDSGEKL